MSNFKPKPIPKNALSEYKLSLSCPPAQGATKPGTLRFSIVKNNPRIDVYTNVPNDKNYGNIRAAMDSQTCYALLELLKLAIDAPANTKWSIDNKNHTFYDGKPSEHAVLVSTTHVGRDKAGCVFIAITAKERPYLKFLFAPSEYHEVKGPDGAPMELSEVTTVYAKAYCQLMTNLMASVLDSKYVEPEPKKDSGYQGNQGKQGGGGGYQNNNGGGGYKKNNYQNNNGGGDNVADDDFPM